MLGPSISHPVSEIPWADVRRRTVRFDDAACGMPEVEQRGDQDRPARADDRL